MENFQGNFRRPSFFGLWDFFMPKFPQSFPSAFQNEQDKTMIIARFLNIVKETRKRKKAVNFKI